MHTVHLLAILPRFFAKLALIYFVDRLTSLCKIFTSAEVFSTISPIFNTGWSMPLCMILIWISQDPSISSLHLRVGILSGLVLVYLPIIYFRLYLESVILVNSRSQSIIVEMIICLYKVYMAMA